MKRRILLLICVLAACMGVRAQYSDIANGIANVLMPAVSGSKSYRGNVEVDYTQGVGRYRTNSVTFTTSQGYQLTDWLYMGAGLGVDVFWSQVGPGWDAGWSGPDWNRQSYTSRAVMIPIFTDFRFKAGSWKKPSFFADLKVGAAFLCTDDYVKIRDGYLTNTTYFYLQPSIGVRIPVNEANAKQALNIGVHYRLITSDYWSGYQSSVVLNGLGANVSFEW